MKRVVVFACMIIVLGYVVAALGDETKGKVEELGWGKFRLVETNDLRRLYHISKKITQYEPSTWRPVVGDEVQVIYTEVPKRSAKILRPDKVKLLKPGPNTVLLTSPVEGEIVETGKTGYKVRVAKVDKIVKFMKHRGTQVVPTGWQPTIFPHCWKGWTCWSVMAV